MNTLSPISAQGAEHLERQVFDIAEEMIGVKREDFTVRERFIVGALISLIVLAHNQELHLQATEGKVRP